MTAANRRKDGLILLFLGVVVFLSIGIAWRRIALVQMGDFKVMYYSARCLLQHGDPYNRNEVERLYDSEGRERTTEPLLNREVKTRFFYPPTVFALTVPIVSMGFRLGAIAWTILLAGGLILAAIAVWDLASDVAPVVAGALAGLLLSNSFWLYMIGNSAGIAVSLCVVALWTFYRKRFVAAGVLCLALSLAIKPNDSGLIWLLLLLAGNEYRKRALQSVAVLVIFSLPLVLWVSHVSPNWLAELRTNMSTFSRIGSGVDPAATGLAGRNMDPIIQLQTVTSIFVTRPGIFDVVVYVVCAPILLVWTWMLLRRRLSQNGFWLAVAVAAPLTMLPTYHYQHDAKLLLLCIPGCGLLWARRGRLGWAALLATTAGIVVNGDIFTAVKVSLTRSIVVPQPSFASRVVTVLLTRPCALVLLATSVFFLWALVREENLAGVSNWAEGLKAQDLRDGNRGVRASNAFEENSLRGGNL